MAIKWLNVCWVFLASKVTPSQSFCRQHPALTAHTQAHVLCARQALVQQWPQPGLDLGQVCRQGSGNFRRASLDTAASSQLLLCPAGPSLCRRFFHEGKAVHGIPQPRFVGLHCIRLKKQIPICQQMQLSHCCVIFYSVYRGARGSAPASCPGKCRVFNQDCHEQDPSHLTLDAYVTVSPPEPSFLVHGWKVICI